MIDRIKRFFGLFDSNGLRYSLSHLRKMKDYIAFLPVEQQAKYADRATISLIYDQAVLLDELRGFSVYSQMANAEYLDTSVVKVEDLNTTAVGNLAYIQLHAAKAGHREAAREILNRHKAYCQKLNTNHT